MARLIAATALTLRRDGANREDGLNVSCDCGNAFTAPQDARLNPGALRCPNCGASFAQGDVAGSFARCAGIGVIPLPRRGG